MRMDKATAEPENSGMLSNRSALGIILVICGVIAIGVGDVGSDRGGEFEGTLFMSLGVGMAVYGLYLLTLHLFDRG